MNIDALKNDQAWETFFSFLFFLLSRQFYFQINSIGIIESFWLLVIFSCAIFFLRRVVEIEVYLASRLSDTDREEKLKHSTFLFVLYAFLGILFSLFCAYFELTDSAFSVIIAVYCIFQCLTNFLKWQQINYRT